jgi:hypothetical protein
MGYPSSEIPEQVTWAQSNGEILYAKGTYPVKYSKSLGDHVGEKSCHNTPHEKTQPGRIIWNCRDLW